MRDIARLAGVSCGTVSNVMNRRGNVSTKKIRLVEDAVRRLGYNANAQAQKLRQESSRHLSVILPDITQRIYGVFYTGLKSLFEEENYDVFLYLTGGSPETERLCLQKALSERPEYIVTLSCARNSKDYKNIKSKVIFINNPFIEPGIHQCSLSFDFSSAAASFAGYIEGGNYSRVALLCDSPVMPEFRYFHKALREALAQEPVTVIPFFYDSRQIYHGAAAVLTHTPGIDLVILSNPEYAGKLRQIRDFLDCPLPEILTFRMSETVRSSLYPGYELDYRRLARAVFDTVKAGSLEGGAPGPSVAVPAGGFSGKPKETPCQQKIRELTLLTVTSPTADILSTLTPYLKRCTGLTLKIAALPYDELSRLLASGRARDFDLLRLDTSWSARFERELFQPLGKWAPLIKPLSDTFLPALNKVFAPDPERLFSLPFDPSIQMLFYRRDLFENATIKRLFYEHTKEKLEVPKDYKEYNRAAAFFSAALNRDSPIRYGATMVYGTASVAACELLPRIRAMGGDIFDHAGNIRVDTPLFRNALEAYLELKPSCGPEINFWWTDALNSFSSGLSAMTVIFINHVSGIVRASDPELSMKVGAAPVPGNFPLLGGGTIGISAGSGKAGACLDFFEWVYSDEIANMITLLGGLSPRASVFENEEILEIYPWLRNMGAHYTRGWRRLTSQRHPDFDPHQFEQILGNAVRNAAMGIERPEEALAKAQLQCDREL
jgi:multiple sugar transport system substrate-binding protein